MNRAHENPIISPNPNHSWEAFGTFNGCVIKDIDTYYMLYRAMPNPIKVDEVPMQPSTIGIAESNDGIHFENRRQLISPQHEWERYGCEDPRITKLEDTYYIFYTALSDYPPSAKGIKVAMATSKDLKTIDKRTLITPFNAKAMAMFPRRINGKIAVIVTANTDTPPAKIAIAMVDQVEDLYSQDFWWNWYSDIDSHLIPLQRSKKDHIEVGAPPVETEYGWLFLYSYIKGYFAHRPTFGIEAVMLDIDKPEKVLGRVLDPILKPEETYEEIGNIPNIVFPSGTVIDKETISLYYGGADTYCCLATAKLSDLLARIRIIHNAEVTVERYVGNPIMTPHVDHSWEAKAVFNPTAWYDGSKVHIVYRAMSDDNTSYMGYASSLDGFHLHERLNDPIYVPRKEFEIKSKPGNSGCEDPRITYIDNKLYVLYTAYDGIRNPRVAMTTIQPDDFVNKRWNWSLPVLISPPGVDDKDACIFPEKVKGKYVIFHRIEPNIEIDLVDSLEFNGNWLECKASIEPRRDYWDDAKIGINATPIKTDKGWLMLYHGINSDDRYYRLGALLLKLDDPTYVLARSESPILQPEQDYERFGQVNNVVFPCGSVVLEKTLYVYYGGGDRVVCVGTVNLEELLVDLLKQRKAYLI